MNEKRTRRLQREAMRARFYRLDQFLSCYFNEDVFYSYGTVEQALTEAIAEYPVDLRQQVRRELETVIEEHRDDVDLREALYGFGVAVHFRKPIQAREFGEWIEQELMASIKAHFEQPAR